MAGILQITSEVLINAYYAKLALEEYEGISDKINAIKKAKLEFFFGLNQKVMLDYAVLQICKVYDQSNKDYKKHTVFEICSFIRDNKRLCDYARIYSPALNTYLNTSHFKKICESDLSDIEMFIKEAERITSDIVSSDDFKRLKTYRNKKIVHLEQLDAELPKEIASIERLYEFIKIAIDLSTLAHELFDAAPSFSPASMKIATYNLVEKIVE